MHSKGGRQSKISLEKNSVASFVSKKNANIFFFVFSQTKKTHYYKNFHVLKINLECKPLKSVISRFGISVMILFYTM